jgi:hypothetical protein
MFKASFRTVDPNYSERQLENWKQSGRPIPPPDVYKQRLVKEYGDRFSLKFLIETGTYLGDMVFAMRDQFERIISVELDMALYVRAVLRFLRLRHIRILHGDSACVLPKILRSLREPALFWLDAHYSGGVTARAKKEIPIVEELTAILAHPVKDHVILVDDARGFINGATDYPTLDMVQGLVAGTGFMFEVCDDVIRICPAKDCEIRDLEKRMTRTVGMTILSILVCTLVSRRHLLLPLLELLNRQSTPQVEVLVNADDGTKPIGTKRNELLDQAHGNYVAFVDDDDLVSEDYVHRILAAVRSSPDCCGLEGIVTFDGRNPRRFIHSMKYDHWFEKDGVYYRPPNHLSPVKREIALQVMFPDISFSEDRDYSMKILRLLASEVHIDSPIYYYRTVSRHLKWIRDDRVPKNLSDLVLKISWQPPFLLVRKLRGKEQLL